MLFCFPALPRSPLRPAFAVATPLPTLSERPLKSFLSRLALAQDTMLSGPVWAQFAEPNTRGTPSNVIRVDPGCLSDKPSLTAFRFGMSAHKGETVCLIDPRIRSTQSLLGDKVGAGISSSTPLVHALSLRGQFWGGDRCGTRWRRTVLTTVKMCSSLPQ
ncbi:hypothetical protein C8R47DRAFT_1078312 [Mycena vitilis]|nr:hypothetical protein C8R47DRAFT_1078312 [Mycena vitilis]